MLYTRLHESSINFKIWKGNQNAPSPHTHTHISVVPFSAAENGQNLLTELRSIMANLDFPHLAHMVCCNDEQVLLVEQADTHSMTFSTFILQCLTHPVNPSTPTPSSLPPHTHTCTQTHIQTHIHTQHDIFNIYTSMPH